ncbi:MAG TPA: hypothetical protein VKU19_14720 [Bryobacteraceae bacterium]|nr:hypothetical protein [Bryobacteraceae bacterium]
MPWLGERAFKLLDDVNNWGQRKQLMGEVDVFQIDSTHELYAHMNVNYVKLPSVPTFDRYASLLDAMRRGEFFVSTGEVLLPEVSLTAGSWGQIRVRAHIRHTFPLEQVLVSWGDGSEAHRRAFQLLSTHSFGDFVFETDVDAANWKWARLSVWDVASNGAFVNPVWRDK